MAGHILFRSNFDLAGCQNCLNIFERRARCVFYCPLTSVSQPFRSIFIYQIQQTHTRLVSLLFYLVTAEDGLNNDLRMVTYFSSPMDKPFAVPMDILLVFRRQMLLNSAVLVESSVQSGG